MSDAASQTPLAAVPDRHQIARLNTLWEIVDAPLVQGGWRARLGAGARRLIGRVLSRQQEFNAATVDHLNRNMAVLEDLHRDLRLTSARLDDVDDGMTRHREALLARERRREASVTALVSSQQELRTAVGVLQQASQSLRREVARLAVASDRSVEGAHGDPRAGAREPRPVDHTDGSSRTDHHVRTPANQFDALDSHKYVGFEDQFRGSADEIRRRVSEYLPVFEGTAEVLDIGCGRGEFLALLRDRGIRARGIDLNPAMVEVCRAQGLDATAIDAVTYLRAQPDASIGGLFAAQVVEHLEPKYLAQLLDAAFDKLRPGALLVLETINPACWFAFFESYIRDITHVRPLHPDTLKYLMVATGFHHVEIRYRAPYPDSEKLQPVAPSPDSTAAALADWTETLNANVEKINRLLFTFLDYAAVGRRP